MRILLDEQLLRQLAPHRFEVFLTLDQNIEFQQNLKNAALFVVVLVALTNKLEDLLPLVPAVMAALESCTPGKLVRIGDSHPSW